MSIREQTKKSSFKPKYEEKNKVVTKFNFVFDQQKVTFKTEIPELPAKAKPKPDEKAYQKKIQQIQKKLDALKQQRGKMKESIRKGTQNFDEQIKTNKNHIELGKKCLVVLKHDLENIVKSISEIDDKISKKTIVLRNLQRGPRENKQQKKTYEQMTYEQLQRQQQKLSTKISISNLNKKEQSEINALISKLGRLKMKAPHGQKPKDNTGQIQKAQDSLNRLRFVKENLKQEESQTKFKIQTIQQDIQDLKDQIVDMEQQKKNPQNQAIYEQTQVIKKQIYELRQERSKIEQEFQKKHIDYNYQQAKIQWIKWATQIQNKKIYQWEAGREQRKRQKLREKNKQKADQGKGTQQKKEDEKGEDFKKPERPRINKYQKQIDNFTFLISYCNQLVGKGQKESVKKQETRQQSKNIQDNLKVGQWSKMKDLQVIKSKKDNLEEQSTVKQKKKKNQKREQETIVTGQNKPTTFSHNIFIQQLFDSAKIVPPTKPEQVQNIVKDLEERLTYFLDNPEGKPDTNTNKEKHKYTAQKYEKIKYNPREKKQKVVNTEDFPSLS